MRFRDLLPANPPLSLQERIRSGLGASLGILLTGLISRAALGSGSPWPVLIPPMGASAVLLFAVPASPLAQPWSIVGGNLVAALVGVTLAMLVADPFWAAALAIGIAIALMMTFRCVHPPSGAVALTAVLGGPAIRDLGYGFVLWPVLANSLLLVVAALAYNNLAGRSYPHTQPRPAAGQGTADKPPTDRVGFTSEDLDAVLRDHDQLLDVSRGDLEAILHETQIRSWGRLSGNATCGAIMSRDVVAVAPDTSLREALKQLREHHVKVLPVTDEAARVVGIVTQTDLLDKAAWSEKGPRLGWRHRVRLTLDRARAPNGSVEDIMTTHVRTVGPESPIAEAVLRMADGGIHHLPVVGPDEKLVGIVSQTDLIPALLASAAAHASPGAAGLASAPA